MQRCSISGVGWCSGCGSLLMFSCLAPCSAALGQGSESVQRLEGLVTVAAREAVKLRSRSVLPSRIRACCFSLGSIC